MNRSSGAGEGGRDHLQGDARIRRRQGREQTRISANLCYEVDSDGGATVQYPADVSGTLTIAPIPGTPNLKVTGKISVFESPTAP